MTNDSQRVALVVSRWTLAAGSIAIGLFGLVAPHHLALAMGDDPALARPLAARDVVIGVGLLRWDGVAPLLLRTVADVSDAVRLRQRSPLAAAGALAFGAWSLVTALASDLTARRTATGRRRAR